MSCIFWFLLITFFSAANGFDVFEENGKVGLKDDQGKVLIPAKYDALGWSDGKFSVVDNVIGYKVNGRWGLITTSNHLLTKNEYEEIEPGEGSLFVAKKHSQLSLRITTGCLNTSGKEVIDFQYDGLRLASLRAVVFTKIGNQYKYGLIDLENKTIIPQQYQNIYAIGSLRFAVENFENKIAIFTEGGKQITGFTIDKIAPFTKNYATIYQNSMQGVIDREGRIKVEPKYRAVAVLEDGTIKVRDGDEWQFLNGQNKFIQKTQADRVDPVGKNLLKVSSAGLVQLTDQQLKPVSATAYSFIGSFEENKAVVALNNKYGLITRTGAVLIQPLYDTLLVDRQRVLVAQQQNKKSSWSLLDTLGNRLSQKAYETLEAFNGKYFTVRNRGFAGALDLNGKEVVACTYDSLLQTRDDLIVVKFRGQYGIVNLREEWIVTPRPNKLHLIGHDRFIEETAKTKFLKSFSGNTIYFSDNRLEIFPDYLYEYLPSGTRWRIDMDGRIVERLEHPQEPIEKVFEESEGYRAILKNGKYGFIDSQARLRIANRYDDVQKFSEGLAPAKLRGHWGFINLQDQIAVQPAYDEVSHFSNGFSYVKLKGLWGMIDKTGKQVLPVRYEEVKLLPSHHLLIRVNEQVGLADASGKILVQPRYHHLEDPGNGFVIVERDGKYGVITLQAISTIPLMYDYISYDPYNQVFLALKKSPWVDIKTGE